MIKDIASEWVEQYTQKVESIMKVKDRSNLVCQLASYRWMKLNQQDPDNQFLVGRWLPNAQKCSRHLWKVRSSFMSYLCDKSQQDDDVIASVYSSSDFGDSVKNTKIFVMNKQECYVFLDNCFDYIKDKRFAMQRANLEVVLENCDDQGIFNEENEDSTQEMYIDSNVITMGEEIDKCGKHLYYLQEISKSEEDFRREELYSCVDICNHFFSMAVMLKDDIDHFNKLKAMHQSIKKSRQVEGALPISDTISNSFWEILKKLDFNNGFKFRFKTDIEDKDVYYMHKVPGINLVRAYERDLTFGEMDVQKYITGSELMSILLVAICMIEQLIFQ